MGGVCDGVLGGGLGRGVMVCWGEDMGRVCDGVSGGRTWVGCVTVCRVEEGCGRGV